MESNSNLDWVLFGAVVVLLLAFGGAWAVNGVEEQVWWLAGWGALLVWCGIFVGVAGRGMWPRRVLRVATAVLVVAGGTQLVDSGWQVQNFLEHGLLMGAPMVLAMRWSDRGREAAGQLALFLSVATFVGHGIYAVGFGREETNFMEMTVGLLRTDAAGADIFLKVVGGLDILVAALLMLGRWFKVALWYMVVWGLVTAVVRLVWFTDGEDPWYSLGVGLAEMGFRLVHGLVPLWLLLQGKWTDEEESVPREGA